MATCNLCPPGERDIPDTEMAAHVRGVHPEIDIDGTRKGDGSTIVHDASLEPSADAPAEQGEWIRPPDSAPRPHDR